MPNIVCLESVVGIFIWSIKVKDNHDRFRSSNIHLLFFFPHQSIIESFQTIYSLILSNLSISYLKIIKYVKREVASIYLVKCL